MREMLLAMTGLGNVGRRFLELLDRKREFLQKQWNIEFILTGVCDSSGALMDPGDLDPAHIVGIKHQGKRIATLPGSIAGLAPADFVQRADANILIELTLTNLQNGEPGLGAIRTALQRKMNVVTANKGPLVVAYTELTGLAKSNDVHLLFSATVTGGLPTLNIGTRDLGVASIDRVEGVFNGTTNYILTRMAEGASFTDALKQAQDAGMAEADPSLDIDGWDAASKLVIIANSVLRRPTTLRDIDVEGIAGVTPEQLQLAASRNQVLKLVALAQRKGADYQFSVRPTFLERSHPLANVSAEKMAVIYHTDINGTIFASIEEEDPYPTAAAVLRDVVHVALAQQKKRL